MSSNADNIYLNVSITNPVSGISAYPLESQAVYDENLTIPVLSNPSEYYCSIFRFSMPLDTIPIFRFPVNFSQNNPNISDLIIGINNDGLFTQPIVYVAANNLIAPAPGASSPFFSLTQAASPYYFIYSVQQFITMINTALNLAFVAAGSPGGTAPFYIYTATTQLISLIVTAGFIASGATIIMNAYLKTYLDSFPFKYTLLPSNNPLVPGLFYYTQDLSTIPYGQTSPYRFDEEYNALDLWFDIRKIIITTSSIPIVQEASPSTVAITNVNGAGNYLPIITDFVVSYNNIQDVSSILVYNPTSQYRLIDMYSNSPISRINLAFYWQSENGNLFPVFLSPGQTITVKIGFLKKELYKHSLLGK